MNYGSAEAERQAAENEARESGEVLALARRAARAGTFDLDIRNGIVRYCPRSLEMLGHEGDVPRDLTPAEWAQHIFPGDAERVLMEGKRARQEKTDLFTEYRIVRPDGGIRWVRGIGRTLLDEQGESVRCIGFNFDVTEEKQAEGRFRRMQAELVQSSRVNAVATMAEALAHELNQPLTVISSYLSGARTLLGGMPADQVEQIQHAFDQASAAAHRASQIVRSFRAMARRRNGEAGATMLHPAIHKALDLALVGVDERGLEIETDLAPDLEVAMDEVQVQQVVYNLLRHALDAVDGLALRRIGLSSRAEGDHVLIRIADNGPGVADADRPHLFEPFATTADHGLGMGLAVSRTIVEACGGRLWIAEGEDSILCLTLPLVVPAA
jgi:PAS domain S-box-containing protein